MARYERIEILGVGVFGEVYKAWDKTENQIVAVKRLSGRHANGLVFSGVREMAREAMSLAACRGIPSVVQIRATHAVSSDAEGDAFIVMEYVGRLNLRLYMQRRSRLQPWWRRPFSEDEVRGIMRQLLEGVKAVHAAGILHRDIRPENVLLDDGTEDRTEKPATEEEGRCKGKVDGRRVKPGEIVFKIGGFGMSIGKKEDPTNRPEVLMLTGYSAPELLLRAREYDDRVDTWGLGCIMTELLVGAGVPMFHADNAYDIMRKICRVVDGDGIKDWSGYHRLPAETSIPTDPAAGLKMFGKAKLRKRYPENKVAGWLGGRTALSSAGFEVLSGLLECNPEKRLTAAEALEKPWFQDGGVAGRSGGCLTSIVRRKAAELSD